jgi:hypothetical protein
LGTYRLAGKADNQLFLERALNLERLLVARPNVTALRVHVSMNAEDKGQLTLFAQTPGATEVQLYSQALWPSRPTATKRTETKTDDSYEEEVTPQQPSGHYEQRCMRTYQSGGYDQFGNFIDGQWVEQCRDVWVQD